MSAHDPDTGLAGRRRGQGRPGEGGHTERRRCGRCQGPSTGRGTSVHRLRPAGARLRSYRSVCI